MSFIFNYNIFYNYYKNHSNLLKTSDNVSVKYYRNIATGYQQIPEKTTLSKNYIVVGTNKIYVSELSNQNLLFTIPVEINGELWDTHYHFVLGKIIPTEKTIKKHTPVMDVIKLHKTVQHPEKHTKENLFCFYEKTTRFTNLTDFSSMKCAQSNGTMQSVFSQEDLEIIYNIIKRPFLSTRGGRKNMNIKQTKTINKYCNRSHKNKNRCRSHKTKKTK